MTPASASGRLDAIAKDRRLVFPEQYRHDRRRVEDDQSGSPRSS